MDEYPYEWTPKKVFVTAIYEIDNFIMTLGVGWKHN
jgi:hypothetical protein